MEQVSSSVTENYIREDVKYMCLTQNSVFPRNKATVLSIVREQAGKDLTMVYTTIATDRNRDRLKEIIYLDINCDGINLGQADFVLLRDVEVVRLKHMKCQKFNKL